MKNLAELYAPLLDSWFFTIDLAALLKSSLANQMASGERTTKKLWPKSTDTPRAITVIRDDTPEIVKRANAAMDEAAVVILRRARQHNTPIVVWRDGKVIELDASSPEFDDVNDNVTALGTGDQSQAPICGTGSNSCHPSTRFHGASIVDRGMVRSRQGMSVYKL
jgi:hypothetical protein